MPSLQATLRHQTIVDTLNRRGNVRVGDLADSLEVSAVTIRADLDYLERQNLLRRTRGGAIPLRPRRFELPLELSSQANSEAKRKIAEKAASLIRDGETVLIDVGSTTTELAKALPRALKDVVVVTNSVNIALILENHPGITVVVTGGTLRPQQHSLVAPYGALMLDHINTDVAFMGCGGVHPEKGFTNTNLPEAEIKKAMINATARVIVIADHRKLMHVATARFADLDMADLLITDDQASPEMMRPLIRAGLEILIA
ncbi:MAG: DeoR/GlpR family DNA-binding transcription regulator [Azospirillaceae bacterium]